MLRRMISGLALLLAASPLSVAAKPIDWAVLPARGERPPPRDPTLMRLTEAIASALETAVSARVSVLDGAMADQACPGDGSTECPRDLALLVASERAVTLWVRPDQSAVEVKVYAKKVGIERSVVLPCKWAQGLLECELAGLAQLAKPSAATTAASPSPSVSASPARGASASAPASPPAPVDPVEQALSAIDKNAAKCRFKGWGELPRAERPAAMAVRFRVAPDGAIKDVRLDPSGFADVPAFACMARAVESTRLPPGVVDEASRQRALPLP